MNPTIPPILKPSRKDWVELNAMHLDQFLTEAADCERKASAFAMQFTSKYPKYKKLMSELVGIAIGNLQNFKLFLDHFDKQGIMMLKEIQKNLHSLSLMYECRHKHRERLLDKFIVASLLESRASERYDQLALQLNQRNLQKLLSKVSARKKLHAAKYLEMASRIFKEEEISKRIKFFLKVEYSVLTSSQPSVSLY